MKVGDELLVDGGMVRFVVIEKIGPDVICWCTDPGFILPRANLTFWRNGSLVQERNAMLPTITSKVCYFFEGRRNSLWEKFLNDIGGSTDPSIVEILCSRCLYLILSLGFVSQLHKEPLMGS